MDLKTKKRKMVNKRKAAELVEDSMLSTAPILDIPPPSVSDPHHKINGASKSILVDPEIRQEGRLLKRRKPSVEEIEVDINAPEPPSKKALRRLKKGKPLPPSKSGADSTPEPEDEVSKKAEAEKRSEHGIWIGNLPWSITKADLRTFFTSNSGIADESITRIHMPSPDDGRPADKVEQTKSWKKQYDKGFAYIDFSTPEAVPQAVALSEQLLGGRRVLIKDNKSFEGRPQKTEEKSRRESKEPSKRVFLGNLRFDTTENSLKEHFEKCGAIEKVMVATFEDSGKCKGYAWITFEELAAAESAVRGYVLVEEEGFDPDSDADSSESAEPADEDRREEAAESKRPKTHKPTMKKCWVDKIHKRPLRREFAEDAQVRYKKRFGKDGTREKADHNGDINVSPDGGESKAKKVVPLQKVDYRTSYAARLTGGIVESKGKKVVF